jgi:hypothetical protein
MRIKHKETGNETNVTISEWTSQYLRNGKYPLWEIIDFNNVVKFYRILDNGKTKKMLMDLSFAKQTVNKNPKEFSYTKEPITEQDYKEYLNLIFKNNQSSLNKSSQSHFWNKIRYIIFEKIRPKRILKPIWKSIVAIILCGLGTLFGYILVEFYKTF